MTTEIDRRPQLTVIEPATGERREQLIAECKSLIQRDKFDVKSWKIFVDRIVELNGGRKDRFGAVKTPYILDRENGRAINLILRRSKEELFAIVQIYPEWISLPDGEKRAVEDRITEPYVNEVISTGRTDTDMVTMTHNIIHPPNHKSPVYESYLGIKLAVIGGNIPIIAPVPNSTTLSGEQQKALAKKIFRTWQSSQPQTPPTPQT